MKKRIFSIYLPQFHPIPENDLFWGKGFTEWHNVASAKPQFEGHYQPHFPGELGYYDLRVQETMEDQAELASSHGIDGFLFYHYWFHGNPVMSIPLQNYLKHQKNKLPYFFCWANENWTRRWDGGETDVLLSQDYDPEETEKHLSYLFQYFNDPQYLKINNCPVLVVYKPLLIPDLEKWVDKVRSYCKRNNYPGIYLIYMLHQGQDNGATVTASGFDSALYFEPSYGTLPFHKYKLTLFDKIGKLAHLMKLKNQLPLVYRHNRIEYEDYVRYRMSKRPEESFKVFPMVFPSWDNTCRRKKGGGNIFVGSDPSKFKTWLKSVFTQYRSYTEEENLVIINAWNEWAEGNHLEPCVKWGRQYLEAVKEVVEENREQVSMTRLQGPNSTNNAGSK
ncbi:MAG: glycoside hydrolase family 99-like domain-containing protein [Chitinophagaceae bacterium]